MLEKQSLVPSALRAEVRTDREVELGGVRFRRHVAGAEKPHVLILEAIDERALELLRRSGEVNFDVLDPGPEGKRLSNEDVIAVGKAKKQEGRGYEIILGFVNQQLAKSEDFFKAFPDLKIIILFARGYNNVGIDLAAKQNIPVTNIGDMLTQAMAELNIGMMLEAHYDLESIKEAQTDGNVSLESLNLNPDSMAQILWGKFLQKTLRLEEMYRFGRSPRFNGAGVAPLDTVLHDQLARYDYAGIHPALGLVASSGKDPVLQRLAKIAHAHELAKIYYHVPVDQRLSQEEEKALHLEYVPTLEKLKKGSQHWIRAPGAVEMEAAPNLTDPGKLFTSPQNQTLLNRSLQGKILGIQSFGNIAKAVARRALTFGMQVKALVRSKKETPPEGVELFNLNDAGEREAFLKQVQILTLLAPENDQSRDLINQETLSKLTSLEILVNTGRGGLLDEAALDQYLRQNPGRLKVRLDVLKKESEFWLNPLSQHPEVKMSGHTGSAVRDIRFAMQTNAIEDNLLPYLAGGPLKNEVTRRAEVRDLAPGSFLLSVVGLELKDFRNRAKEAFMFRKPEAQAGLLKEIGLLTFQGMLVDLDGRGRFRLFDRKISRRDKGKKTFRIRPAFIKIPSYANKKVILQLDQDEKGMLWIYAINPKTGRWIEKFFYSQNLRYFISSRRHFRATVLKSAKVPPLNYPVEIHRMDANGRYYAFRKKPDQAGKRREMLYLPRPTEGRYRDAQRDPDLARIYLRKAGRNNANDWYGFPDPLETDREKAIGQWIWNSGKEKFENVFFLVPGTGSWFTEVLSGRHPIKDPVFQRWSVTPENKTIEFSEGLRFKAAVYYFNRENEMPDEFLLVSAPKEPPRFDIYEVKEGDPKRGLFHFDGREFIGSKFYRDGKLEFPREEATRRFLRWSQKGEKQRPLMTKVARGGTFRSITTRLMQDSKGRSVDMTTRRNVGGAPLLLRYTVFSHEQQKRRGLEVVELNRLFEPQHVIRRGYEDRQGFHWLIPRKNDEWQIPDQGKIEKEIFELGYGLQNSFWGNFSNGPESLYQASAVMEVSTASAQDSIRALQYILAYLSLETARRDYFLSFLKKWLLEKKAYEVVWLLNRVRENLQGHGDVTALQNLKQLQKLIAEQYQLDTRAEVRELFTKQEFIEYLRTQNWIVSIKELARHFGGDESAVRRAFKNHNLNDMIRARRARPNSFVPVIVATESRANRIREIILVMKEEGGVVSFNELGRKLGMTKKRMAAKDVFFRGVNWKQILSDVNHHILKDMFLEILDQRTMNVRRELVRALERYHGLASAEQLTHEMEITYRPEEYGKKGRMGAFTAARHFYKLPLDRINHNRKLQGKYPFFKELVDRHTKRELDRILAYMEQHGGPVTLMELAEHLGVTHSAVYTRLRHPDSKRYFKYVNEVRGHLGLFPLKIVPLFEAKRNHPTHNPVRILGSRRNSELVRSLLDANRYYHEKLDYRGFNSFLRFTVKHLHEILKLQWKGKTPARQARYRRLFENVLLIVIDRAPSARLINFRKARSREPRLQEYFRILVPRALNTSLWKISEQDLNGDVLKRFERQLERVLQEKYPLGPTIYSYAEPPLKARAEMRAVNFLAYTEMAFDKKEPNATSVLLEHFGLSSDGFLAKLDSEGRIEVFKVMKRPGGKQRGRWAHVFIEVKGHENQSVRFKAEKDPKGVLWLHVYEPDSDQLIYRAFYHVDSHRQNSRRFVYGREHLKMLLFKEPGIPELKDAVAFHRQEENKSHIYYVFSWYSKGERKSVYFPRTLESRYEGIAEDPELATIYGRLSRENGRDYIYGFLDPEETRVENAIAKSLWRPRKIKLDPVYFFVPGTPVWFYHVLTGNYKASKSYYGRLSLNERGEGLIHKYLDLHIGDLFKWGGPPIPRDVVIVNSPLEPGRLDVYLAKKDDPKRGVFKPGERAFIASRFYNENKDRLERASEEIARRHQNWLRSKKEDKPPLSVLMTTSRGQRKYGSPTRIMKDAGGRFVQFNAAGYRGVPILVRFIKWVHQGKERKGIEVVALDRNLEPQVIFRRGYQLRGRFRWIDARKAIPLTHKLKSEIKKETILLGYGSESESPASSNHFPLTQEGLYRAADVLQKDGKNWRQTALRFILEHLSLEPRQAARDEFLNYLAEWVSEKTGRRQVLEAISRILKAEGRINLSRLRQILSKSENRAEVRASGLQKWIEDEIAPFVKKMQSLEGAVSLLEARHFLLNGKKAAEAMEKRRQEIPKSVTGERKALEKVMAEILKVVQGRREAIGFSPGEEQEIGLFIERMTRVVDATKAVVPEPPAPKSPKVSTAASRTKRAGSYIQKIVLSIIQTFKEDPKQTALPPQSKIAVKTGFTEKTIQRYAGPILVGLRRALAEIPQARLRKRIEKAVSEKEKLRAAKMQEYLSRKPSTRAEVRTADEDQPPYYLSDQQVEEINGFDENTLLLKEVQIKGVKHPTRAMSDTRISQFFLIQGKHGLYIAKKAKVDGVDPYEAEKNIQTLQNERRHMEKIRAATLHPEKYFPNRKPPRYQNVRHGVWNKKLQALILPYLEGENAYDFFIHQKKAFPHLEQYVRAAVRMMGAVVFVNLLGIVHRDIKLENFFIIKRGQGKNAYFEFVLIDLGLAFDLRPEDGKMADSPSPSGTSGYAPAEQWTPGRIPRLTDDVHAMGVMFLRMLKSRGLREPAPDEPIKKVDVGDGDFEASDLRWSEIVGNDPRNIEHLSQRIQGIQIPFKDIIDKAIDPMPPKRYPTVERMDLVFRDRLEKDGKAEWKRLDETRLTPQEMVPRAVRPAFPKSLRKKLVPEKKERVIDLTDQIPDDTHREAAEAIVKIVDSDLELHSLLGSNALGHVYLVKRKSDRKAFALKIPVGDDYWKKIRIGKNEWQAPDPDRQWNLLRDSSAIIARRDLPLGGKARHGDPHHSGLQGVAEIENYFKIRLQMPDGRSVESYAVLMEHIAGESIQDYVGRMKKTGQFEFARQLTQMLLKLRRMDLTLDGLGPQDDMTRDYLNHFVVDANTNLLRLVGLGKIKELESVAEESTQLQEEGYQQFKHDLKMRIQAYLTMAGIIEVDANTVKKGVDKAFKDFFTPSSTVDPSVPPEKKAVSTRLRKPPDTLFRVMQKDKESRQKVRRPEVRSQQKSAKTWKLVNREELPKTLEEAFEEAVAGVPEADRKNFIVGLQYEGDVTFFRSLRGNDSKEALSKILIAELDKPHRLDPDAPFDVKMETKKEGAEIFVHKIRPAAIGSIGIPVVDVVIRVQAGELDRVRQSFPELKVGELIFGTPEQIDEFLAGNADLMERAEYTVGGSLSTLRVLNRLRESTLRFEGYVGNDKEGKIVLDSLQKERFPIDGIQVIPDLPTSRTLIFVESDGSRSFVHVIGANERLGPANANRLAVYFSQQKNPVLHIGYEALSSEEYFKNLGPLLDDLKKRVPELRVVLDTVSDFTGLWKRFPDAGKKILEAVDVFAANLKEGANISGKTSSEEMADWFLHAMKKGTVLLKADAKGSYIQNEALAFQLIPALPAATVEHYAARREDQSLVRDGTGSGDAYVAGILYGLRHRLGLTEAAGFGTVLGGLSFGQVGGGTLGPHNLDTVKQLYAQYRDLYHRPEVRRQIDDQVQQIAEYISGNKAGDVVEITREKLIQKYPGFAAIGDEELHEAIDAYNRDPKQAFTLTPAQNTGFYSIVPRAEVRSEEESLKGRSTPPQAYKKESPLQGLSLQLKKINRRVFSYLASLMFVTNPFVWATTYLGVLFIKRGQIWEGGGTIFLGVSVALGWIFWALPRYRKYDDERNKILSEIEKLKAQGSTPSAEVQASKNRIQRKAVPAILRNLMEVVPQVTNAQIEGRHSGVDGFDYDGVTIRVQEDGGEGYMDYFFTYFNKSGTWNVTLHHRPKGAEEELSLIYAFYQDGKVVIPGSRASDKDQQTFKYEESPFLDVAFDSQRGLPVVILKNGALVQLNDFIRGKITEEDPWRRRIFHKLLIQKGFFIEENEAVRRKEENQDDFPGLKIVPARLVQFERKGDQLVFRIEGEEPIHSSDLNAIAEIFLNGLNRHRLDVLVNIQKRTMTVRQAQTREWLQLKIDEDLPETIEAVLEGGLISRPEVRGDLKEKVDQILRGQRVEDLSAYWYEYILPVKKDSEGREWILSNGGAWVLNPLPRPELPARVFLDHPEVGEDSELTLPPGGSWHFEEIDQENSTLHLKMKVKGNLQSAGEALGRMDQGSVTWQFALQWKGTEGWYQIDQSPVPPYPLLPPSRPEVRSKGMEIGTALLQYAALASAAAVAAQVVTEVQSAVRHLDGILSRVGAGSVTGPWRNRFIEIFDQAQERLDALIKRGLPKSDDGMLPAAVQFLQDRLQNLSARFHAAPLSPSRAEVRAARGEEDRLKILMTVTDMDARGIRKEKKGPRYQIFKLEKGMPLLGSIQPGHNRYFIPGKASSFTEALTPGFDQFQDEFAVVYEPDPTQYNRYGAVEIRYRGQRHTIEQFHRIAKRWSERHHGPLRQRPDEWIYRAPSWRKFRSIVDAEGVMTVPFEDDEVITAFMAFYAPENFQASWNTMNPYYHGPGFRFVDLFKKIHRNQLIRIVAASTQTPQKFKYARGIRRETFFRAEVRNLPKYPDSKAVRRKLRWRNKKGWKNNPGELVNGVHSDQILYLAARRFKVPLPMELKMPSRDQVKARRREILDILKAGKSLDPWEVATALKKRMPKYRKMSRRKLIQMVKNDRRLDPRLTRHSSRKKRFSTSELLEKAGVAKLQGLNILQTAQEIGRSGGTLSRYFKDHPLEISKYETAKGQQPLRGARVQRPEYLGADFIQDFFEAPFTALKEIERTILKKRILAESPKTVELLGALLKMTYEGIQQHEWKALKKAREYARYRYQKPRDLRKLNLNRVPVERLGYFSPRVRSVFHRLGIKTVGQLLRQSPEEMLPLENFSEKSLHEIEGILDFYGLRPEHWTEDTPRAKARKEESEMFNVKSAMREPPDSLHIKLSTLSNLRAEVRMAKEVESHRPDLVFLDILADRLNWFGPEKDGLKRALEDAPRPLIDLDGKEYPIDQDIRILLGLIRLWTHPAFTPELKEALQFALSISIRSWTHEPYNLRYLFSFLQHFGLDPDDKTLQMSKNISGYLYEILVARALQKAGYQILSIGEKIRSRGGRRIMGATVDLKVALQSSSGEIETFLVEVKQGPTPWTKGQKMSILRERFFAKRSLRTRQYLSYLKWMQKYQRKGKMVVHGREYPAPRAVLLVTSDKILSGTTHASVQEKFYRRLRKAGIQDPEEKFRLLTLDTPEVFSLEGKEKWLKDEKLRAFHQNLSQQYEDQQIKDILQLYSQKSRPEVRAEFDPAKRKDAVLLLIGNQKLAKAYELYFGSMGYDIKKNFHAVSSFEGAVTLLNQGLSPHLILYPETPDGENPFEIVYSDQKTLPEHLPVMAIIEVLDPEVAFQPIIRVFESLIVEEFPQFARAEARVSVKYREGLLIVQVPGEEIIYAENVKQLAEGLSNMKNYRVIPNYTQDRIWIANPDTKEGVNLTLKDDPQLISKAIVSALVLRAEVRRSPENKTARAISRPGGLSYSLKRPFREGINNLTPDSHSVNKAGRLFPAGNSRLKTALRRVELRSDPSRKDRFIRLSYRAAQLKTIKGLLESQSENAINEISPRAEVRAGKQVEDLIEQMIASSYRGNARYVARERLQALFRKSPLTSEREAALAGLLDDVSRGRREFEKTPGPKKYLVAKGNERLREFLSWLVKRPEDFNPAVQILEKLSPQESDQGKIQQWREDLTWLADKIQKSTQLKDAYPKVLRLASALDKLSTLLGLRAETRVSEPLSNHAKFEQINRLRPKPLHRRRVPLWLARKVLDQLLLKEDNHILNIFETPAAIAGPPAEEMFQDITSKVTAAVSSSKAIGIPNFLSGTVTNSNTKIGFVVGVKMFEKYAPLLVAWQKQYGNQIRFAVVTPEDSEEASVIMRAANAISRDLPPDQWIIPYENATAAMTALNRKRFFTIEGLGLPLDHALLNKIPGFRPKTEAEMDQIASEFPGLQALLAQFTAQLSQALETAA